MNAASMRLEWAAHAAIARQALAWRRSVGSNWLTWALVAISLLIAGGVGFATGEWRKAIGFGAGLPLSLLAWLWWFYLIDAVRRQNHPAAFKLVPNMARRSLAVLFAVWAVCSVALGLIMSVAVGAPLELMLAAGVFFAVSGAMIRWQANVIVVALCLAPYAARKLGLVEMPWTSPGFTDAEVNAAGLAVLAASAWAIAGALGRPRALPFKWDVSAQPLYARFLKADCARGDRTRLLMHALGPGAHSKTQAIALAVGLALGALLAIPADVPLGVVIHFFFGAALALQFAFADRMSAQIYARRHEQAVVRLAVRAPASAELNKVLAAAVIRQFVRWWAGTTIAALAVAALLKVDPAELARMAAVFCITLMAGGTLLHDYAKKPHFSTLSKLAVVTGFVFTYIALLAAMTGKLGALWWCALAAGAVAAAAAFAYYRWRGMAHTPAAFPAGRE